ncbi:hypothetical protein RhiirA4_470542, partial [Rhizophagus irregularis]
MPVALRARAFNNKETLQNYNRCLIGQMSGYHITSFILSKKERNRLEKSNTEVVLIHLYNSQKDIDEFLNKVRTHSTNTYNCDIQICMIKYINIIYKWRRPYRINYIKKNFKIWTSGNKKIDDFIQKVQLKINIWNDTVFEWIPYNKFDDIKEIGKSGYSSVYSATWKDGPLYYDNNSKEWIRKSDKKVILKCLMISEFLNVVKAYLTDKDKIILEVYGISQNPDTNDYVI